MSIENHISFIEGRPVKCHEFCDLVFDQLARIKDPKIKSILETPIHEMNRTLLRVESERVKGGVPGIIIEEAIIRCEALISEIDELKKGASSDDKYSLGVIYYYSSDIWKNYIQKLPIK